MASVARNSNTIRKVPGKVKDRENLPPAFRSAIAGKENIFSERRHAGRKQAFGELKNVLHNTGAPTPMKASKLQLFSPLRFAKNAASPRHSIKSKKSPTLKKSSGRFEQIRSVPNVDVLPKPDPDYNELEYVWSQRTQALADRTMSRIIHGGDDDDLLLPLPDISAMETFETVFGEIEPISMDYFADLPEPELLPLPSLELEDLIDF